MGQFVFLMRPNLVEHASEIDKATDFCRWATNAQLVHRLQLRILSATFKPQSRLETRCQLSRRTVKRLIQFSLIELINQDRVSNVCNRFALTKVSTQSRKLKALERFAVSDGIASRQVLMMGPPRQSKTVS